MQGERRRPFAAMLGSRGRQRPVSQSDFFGALGPGFFFQRVAAAFLARADRAVAVIDSAAFLPPLLPSFAKYFRNSAGSFAMI